VDLTTKTFDSFRELATRYGARLVISLAPQAETYRTSEVGPRIEAFNRFAETYRSQHPELGVVPFTYWPNERYSSTEHVATPWTVANSVRLGEALQQILGDPSGLKADGPAGQDRARVEAVVLDEKAPVYGFGPVRRLDGQPVRALRDGRDEGLLYAHAHPGVREVLLQPASDVSDDLAATTSVAVFGEAAERLPDEAIEGRRHLVFRLPPGAARYNGWLELLISTRGLTAWPGNGLDAAARGPSLSVARISFR
jgi:hypothetical protein